ncbi:unnamed protein product [Rotaria magnacalcarata]|uniref:SWIM-type domain-containing protein n=1 Tax=Rotaria magnacalcarata TaxID=392030 RepID=A0A816PQ90_9BILA|nr:unnamed protein product [Rotaria magnacalcarata]CAF4389528.1 unnamed protein product [Rotaria magnacalcarata]
MDTLNVHSCYLCEKGFRKNERIRSLENYEALWNFVVANKLVRINLHNGCYMKLYNKKRNAQNDTENQGEGVTMNLDLQRVDVGTQTDFTLDYSTNQSRTTTDDSTVHNENSYQPPSSISSNVTTSTSNNCIELPFYRLAKSNKTCSICGKDFALKNISCQEVDQTTRVQSLLDHHIYIPNGNAMKKELQSKNDQINQLGKNPPLNFDEDPMLMSDSNCRVLTGLTRDQFSDLCSAIPASALRHTDVRSPRTAIACLLVKLRLGLSHEALCTLFCIDDKRKMARILDRACTAIKKYFVPKHLGFDHIERSKVIKDHTRPLAKILLGENDSDQAILILDGTYCYIQKSSNNLLQRRTYSMHKGRPLVKPMMIVSTDGYIISTIGPFLADGLNNDAQIMKNIIYNNQDGFMDWVRPNDLFVVDRGFRDCVPHLEKYGYKVKMPFFLNKNQSQFTTAEANETRLITKIRWVIESANGRVKQWQFFNKIIPNSMLEKIDDYFQIVCAMINCYRPVFIQDTSHDDEIAAKMLNLVKQNNAIKNYVEKMKAKKGRTVKWIEIAATNEIDNFPKMTFNELQDLTLGIYQLKQARSYIAEHISSHGSFIVKVTSERRDLLRVEIQSRHKKNTKYDVYVQYDNRSISGWYCTCINGCRVVGCCAHVATIIYYLAYARHNRQQLQRRTFNYYNSLVDAHDYSELSDSDSADSDEENSNILYSLTTNH